MSDIVINATSRETRIALLEQRIVTELFIEHYTNHGLVGNIYRGRVAKILPGMQAAFVDIGLPKAGFLHISDLLVDPHMPPWDHETAPLDLDISREGQRPSPPCLPSRPMPLRNSLRKARSSWYK